MGNLFSRNKQQEQIVNEDDQFFDCLTDDETHEQNTDNEPQTTISHYYAVWIPSNVETTGKSSFLFERNLILFFFRKSIRFR